MALAAVNGDNRRGKTLVFLIFCCSAGMLPHFWGAINNLFPSISLALLLGGYGLSVVLRDRDVNHEIKNQKLSPIEGNINHCPSVDVLVAARDEENVVERLVERLNNIEYPQEKISFWVIDDGSIDRTPFLLNQLRQQFPTINVLTRSRFSGGGKSGALNDALKEVNGEWVFILDADAQLQNDVLLRLVSFAQKGGWAAVQLRKAVVNYKQNLLASFQSMEMAMDTVIQSGRFVSGGVAELRGNGQLINRKVLDYCGGFNEATVTDDLDLSFRFLIAHASIGILWNPPVQEEAVQSIAALFRQRQRWAEGGLQRFFDYWPSLVSKRLNFTQKIDLLCFFLLQYALPVVSFVDCIIAITLGSIPFYWPLSLVAFSVSGLAYWKGCIRDSEGPSLPVPTTMNLLLAILYLTHWFIVIPTTSLKMTFFPKNLIWAKTKHQGN